MGSFKFKKSIIERISKLERTVRSWKVKNEPRNNGVNWKEKNEAGSSIFEQTFVTAFIAKRDMTYD